jgi:23S rRNA (cytosine1962-C5)-methyltransferase
VIAHSGPEVRVKLRRDLRRSIRRGHPWVFSDAVSMARDASPGQRALVIDNTGRPMARGYVDPSGPLALRICVTDAKTQLDASWVRARLSRATSWRLRHFDPTDTNAYRLINGEGDGLPGLVVDRYGDVAVLKLDGPIAEAFWDAAAIAGWLVEHVGVATVLQRFRTRGAPKMTPLIGDAPTEAVAFVEHGCRFVADLAVGQKTGFFLDQRENRARVGAISKGQTVLNIFGYTGGFSVYAGLAGATEVTTVDIAAPAIADAEVNWRLNGLDPAAHHGVAQDAFVFLDEAAKKKARYDVVVLDPPAFAPSKKTVGNATEAYKRVVAAGVRVVSSGGVLVAASCSAHVHLPAFQDLVAEAIGQARRSATLFGVHGQPIDHPAPLVCKELHYLKCVFLRLD